MKDKLISFETAKLAKEKGFGKTLEYIYPHSYTDEGNLILNSCNNTEPGFTCAVTQSLLQKWLREVHKIIVNSSIHGTEKDKASFGYSIQWYNKRWFHKGNELEIHWNTYEEALESGLQEGLKLIKP